jgi:hypothetical protein
LSLTQAYTKLYWKDRIEPVVEERWKAEWLAEHPDYDASVHRIPKHGLAFQNHVVRLLYESEPESIKKGVEQYRDETGDQSDSDDDELDGAAKRRKDMVLRQS